MRVKCDDNACIKNKDGECEAQIIHLEIFNIEEKCKEYCCWEAK